MGVKVFGMKEILDNLEKKIKVISKSKKEALVEVGERGLGILKDNTPVGRYPGGGRLRASMGYSVNGESVKTLETPRKSDDKIRAGGNKDSVIMGTNVDYGPPVEWIPSKSTANLGFMRRSYKQLLPKAKQIFEEVMKKAVMK